MTSPDRNTPTFLGVDLTGSRSRPSAAALLDGDGRLVRIQDVGSDDELLELAQASAAAIVALDAPLALPAGLCCLDPTCPCRPTAAPGLRAAELALARRGIPCYFTTKRTIIRSLAERGLRLAPRLRAAGCQVIEVYPYATRVVLWGKGQPRKTTPKGLAALRRNVGRLVLGADAWAPRLGHDQADAVLAAHTAFLHHLGRTERLGDDADGPIVLPSVTAPLHHGIPSIPHARDVRHHKIL